MRQVSAGRTNATAPSPAALVSFEQAWVDAVVARAAETWNASAAWIALADAVEGLRLAPAAARRCGGGQVVLGATAAGGCVRVLPPQG